MSKYITKEEAYDLYLKQGYDEIMPFEDYKEPDFIEYISNHGLIVISEEALNVW